MEKNSENKKRVIVDDVEDLEIRKIAYNKKQNNIIIYSLIIFMLISITMVFYIYSFSRYKNATDNSKIEFSKENYKILISNAGEINEKITNKSFINKDKIIIERVNKIEVLKKENFNDDKIFYNIKLNITKNDFKYNEVATTKSELLIKVSYSFDNENWTYINNVLQSQNTTISPLTGNYYDIAGIESEIRIATKKEINLENPKMYWKIEVFINKTKNQNYENNLKMNFYIKCEDN